MKQCEQCNIKVGSPVQRCPLCYSVLSRADGVPELPSYPDLSEQAEKYNLLLRILLFLSITVGSVCFTINALTFKNYWWSLIIVVNIIYIWVAISTAVRKHSRLGFNVLVQALSLAALMTIVDRLSGGPSGWALNYAVPLLFVSAMLCITIIIIVKRVAISRFILYFLLISLLGFVPIVLRAFSLTTVLWPSLVSAMYSGISLVSIFIFADNATKVELKKRFHV